MSPPGLEKSSSVELPRLPDITGLDVPSPSGSAGPAAGTSIPIRPSEDARDPTEMSVDIAPAQRPSSQQFVAPPQPPEARNYPEADQLVDRTFGGYRMEAKIGQGGMGVVYKGRQVSLDRVVAIKILNKALYENKEFIRRFEREAKSIARINHPNIVAVYDFGVHDGLWFMVNEFVEGYSLAKLITDRLVVPVPELIPLIAQSLAGLAHVSLTNIVHRDIKPDNILITKDGIAKIADFGLAKDTNEGNDSTDLTAVGLAMGTPAYMSPEQCMGRKLDGRSDQYSLGVTAYLALTGEKPFTGQSSFEVMTKQREHTPPLPSQLNPAVPVELARVVMRMLAKSPEDRFPDAETCRHAWLDIAEHLGLAGSKHRSGEHEVPGLRQRSSRQATPLPVVEVPPAKTVATALPVVDVSALQPTASGELRLPKGPDRWKIGSDPMAGGAPGPATITTSGPATSLGATGAASTTGIGSDRTRRGPSEGGEANPATESRLGSERYRGPGGVTCPRCGHLNRPETTACVRCGAVSRAGDSAAAMRDQLQEAQRLTDQGHHREAATIWARLADQETDKRQRSILRAKEREVRKADLNRQIGDITNRAKGMVERGDLQGALEVLEQGQRLATERTTILGPDAVPPLASEVAAVRSRLTARRRNRMLLIVGGVLVLVLGGTAWWFQQAQRPAPAPTPVPAPTPAPVPAPEGH